MGHLMPIAAPFRMTATGHDLTAAKDRSEVICPCLYRRRRFDHAELETGFKMLMAVCRQQHGAAPIAVADDLEQAVDAELVDSQLAQLVDAQDLGFDVGRQRPLEATGCVRGGQRVDDHFGRR